MKRYYYNTTGIMNDVCTEPCPLIDCMIGSSKCKECENCKSFSTEEGWIKCEILENQ